MIGRCFSCRTCAPGKNFGEIFLCGLCQDQYANLNVLINCKKCGKGFLDFIGSGEMDNTCFACKIAKNNRPDFQPAFQPAFQSAFHPDCQQPAFQSAFQPAFHPDCQPAFQPAFHPDCQQPPRKSFVQLIKKTFRQNELLVLMLLFNVGIGFMLACALGPLCDIFKGMSIGVRFALYMAATIMHMLYRWMTKVDITELEFNPRPQDSIYYRSGINCHANRNVERDDEQFKNIPVQSYRLSNNMRKKFKQMQKHHGEPCPLEDYQDDHWEERVVGQEYVNEPTADIIFDQFRARAACTQAERTHPATTQQAPRPASAQSQPAPAQTAQPEVPEEDFSEQDLEMQNKQALGSDPANVFHSDDGILI